MPFFHCKRKYSWLSHHRDASSFGLLPCMVESHCFLGPERKGILWWILTLVGHVDCLEPKVWSSLMSWDVAIKLIVHFGKVTGPDENPLWWLWNPSGYSVRPQRSPLDSEDLVEELLSLWGDTRMNEWISEPFIIFPESAWMEYRYPPYLSWKYLPTTIPAKNSLWPASLNQTGVCSCQWSSDSSAKSGLNSLWWGATWFITLWLVASTSLIPTDLIVPNVI